MAIQSHLYDQPVEALLAIFEWEIRREFMQRMMMDEAKATLLVLEWPRMFPVVSGQDVTLANRLEMLDWLDGRSCEASTFWMALVVLTDPEAFAGWRVPVRDRMLAADDPATLPEADAWMRALNLLLAMDAPGDAVALTQPLLRHPNLMRRALRERVRGMDGHLPAMLDALVAIDADGGIHAAAAMWVDLKHLAERSPNPPHARKP